MIALRWALGNSILTSSYKSNSPFTYNFCESALEKLGGYVFETGNLWEHPVVSAFYDTHKECENCQSYFKENELIDGYCAECAADCEET